MGRPLSSDPLPFSAANISSRLGSYTTPAMRSPLVFQRDGNAKDRVAVGEVGGAVERVNVPAEVASGFATAAFFANQVMLRPLPAYALHNHLF